MRTALETAAFLVGGQNKLAEALNVTPQAVNKWVKADRAPAERVIEIERVTNGEITRHELRPDLYPEHSAA